MSFGFVHLLSKVGREDSPLSDRLRRFASTLGFLGLACLSSLGGGCKPQQRSTLISSAALRAISVIDSTLNSPSYRVESAYVGKNGRRQELTIERLGRSRVRSTSLENGIQVQLLVIDGDAFASDPERPGFFTRFVGAPIDGADPSRSLLESIKKSAKIVEFSDRFEYTLNEGPSGIGSTRGTIRVERGRVVKLTMATREFTQSFRFTYTKVEQIEKPPSDHIVEVGLG